VTTTKIDIDTEEQKDVQREELARQIKAYLAKGGKVTQCPPRTFTPTEGPKKRFAGSRFDSLTDPTNRDVGASTPYKKQRRQRIKVWQSATKCTKSTLYGALKCFMYHIMYKAPYKAHLIW
jgi:hypothetical protein